MKHFLLLICSTLLFACSDCECVVENGKSNFDVQVEYKVQKSSINIFQNDTTMVRYVVTVYPEAPQPRVFIGEFDPSNKDYSNDIVWYNGRDGKLVGPETSTSLKLCLKLKNWGEEIQLGNPLNGLQIDDTSAIDIPVELMMADPN